MLSPKKDSKSRKRPFQIFAFDTETYGDMNEFYMGSVYTDKGPLVFYDKEEMKKFILSKQVYRRKSFVTATNLMFDFFTLFDYNELDDFNFIFRGSEMLSCQKVLKLKSQNRKVRFIDTYHFASKVSLKNLGKIIGIPKLPSPSYIGEIPNDDPYISLLEDGKTYNQKEYLERYNIRDSEITYKFTMFFQQALIDIGGELKVTTASISMNYFRLKYLKDTYRTPNHQENTILFNAYYGGRTEAFKRGKVKDLFYYDFNSLYPSVMLNEFPNPNSMYYTNKSNRFYIDTFEGVSKVVIRSPDDILIPLLPFRDNGKLIFPKGTIEGHYTHVELRKALSIGYEILSYGESLYFTDKINIFSEFVRDNYENRLKYKKEGNPIEYIFKIILNSLYGKFAQKYDEKIDIHFINNFDFSRSNIEKFNEVEILKEFFVITKQDNTKVPSFLQPIWSIYTTAYGRLKLYDSFERVGFDNVYYCDTDSIFTSRKLEESYDLGGLKLECFINEGLIIKPKFYEIDGKVKAKGLKGFNRKENLIDLINDGSYKTYKFMKLKETLRRNESFRVNQKVIIEKSIDFEDTKRIWESKFNIETLQESLPIIIE